MAESTASSFRILKGDSSRISMDITPFHNGWFYFTSDNGKLYVDSEVGGSQKRICINPHGGSKAVTGTLTKDRWSNGQQTLLVSGLGANQNGYIGIPHEVTDAQIDAARNADLRICNQSDGSLTIGAFGDVPQIDIPVVTVMLD